MIWLASLVVVGVIAGWLAGRIMRGNGFGLAADLIIGVIGAFVGAFVFQATGVEFGTGLVGGLAVAFGGALLLLRVVRLFTGRRKGRSVWS